MSNALPVASWGCDRADYAVRVRATTITAASTTRRRASPRARASACAPQGEAWKSWSLCATLHGLGATETARHTASSHPCASSVTRRNASAHKPRPAHSRSGSSRTYAFPPNYDVHRRIPRFRLHVASRRATQIAVVLNPNCHGRRFTRRAAGCTSNAQTANRIWIDPTIGAGGALEFSKYRAC